jgi:sugar/nucleoside kinase (ribokinase family)
VTSAYGRVAERLADGFSGLTFSSFPDGSLDHFSTLYDGERRVRERSAFAEAVAVGRDSFGVRHERTELGGQSVNAARQAHALDADVTLVGHLDDERFDLPFTTASMGRPSEVTVVCFDSDDLLLVAESTAVREWALSELRTVAPNGVEAFFAADAVWCGNWATIPNMTAALGTVATLGGGGTFLFDPGPLSGASEGRIEALVDALGSLAEAFDLVVSVNGDEAERLAAAVGVDADRDGRLRALRDRTGAVVVEHEVDAALAATATGVVRVPMLDAGSVVTDTGGGDRFGAGVALARAAGWDWSLALAAGNACAGHYVATGNSGDGEALSARAARAASR